MTKEEKLKEIREFEESSVRFVLFATIKKNRFISALVSISSALLAISGRLSLLGPSDLVINNKNTIDEKA